MDDVGRPLNPDFVLNFPRYQGAQVLLARQNFGCGSSREHAPWALDGYGIRCVIACSYADIFYNNCFKNGILPIVLAEDIIDKLFEETLENEGYCLKINLAEQSITRPVGGSIHFEVDAFKRKCLLDGLDDIGQTLQLENKIKAYEANRRELKPWLFMSQ